VNEDGLNLNYVKYYLEQEGEATLMETIHLMQMKPHSAVLGVLDHIFDYLEFEELEKIVLVSKLFWFVATQDRLFTKFDLDSSIYSSQSGCPDYEIQKLIKNVFENEHSKVFSESSTKIRSDTNNITTRTDSNNKLYSNTTKIHKFISDIKMERIEENQAQEYDFKMAEPIKANVSVSEATVENNIYTSKNTKMATRRTDSALKNVSLYTPESRIKSEFEKSPSCFDNKCRKIHKMDPINESSDNEKDGLLQTLVFTENMRDACSNPSQIEKCYKTYNSSECTKGSIKKVGDIKTINKRRNSNMVRLNVPQRQPAKRRLTRVNLPGMQKLIIPNQMLAAINESLNESQDILSPEKDAPKFEKRMSFFPVYNNQLWKRF